MAGFSVLVDRKEDTEKTEFRKTGSAVYKTGIIVLIFISIQCCSCTSSVNKINKKNHVDSLIQKGDYYFSEGIYNRAHSCYKGALKRKGPLYCNIFYRLAQTSLELKRKKTVYYLKYSFFSDPKDFRTYLLYGRVLGPESKEKADRMFVKALQLAPGGMKHDVQAEIDKIKKSTMVKPVKSGSISDIAGKYVQILQKEKDISAIINRTSSMRPDRKADILSHTASLCYKKGMKQSAVSLYMLAWQNGKNGDILITAGNICVEMGELVKAAKMYMLFSDKNPDNQTGYYNLGVVYLFKGFQERSEALFKKAGREFSERVKDLKKALEEEEEIDLCDYIESVTPGKKKLPRKDLNLD